MNTLQHNKKEQAKTCSIHKLNTMKKHKKIECSSLKSVMNTRNGRSDGIRTHDYQEKYSRLTCLERVVILLIFLLLRLPLSATGGGRLRHIVPQIASRQKEFIGSKHESAAIKNPLTPEGIRGFLVGVTGFEPTTSWSRTKRTTKLCHTPFFFAL